MHLYIHDVAIITSLLKFNSLCYRFSLPYLSHQFAQAMQGHVSHRKKPISISSFENL